MVLFARTFARTLAHMRAAVRNLFRKSAAEARLDAEVRNYADLLTDENIAAGLPPTEARRLALAQAGGIEQIKQSVRDRRAGIGVDNLAQDLRYALRQMRRSPSVAALTILTLAIGIGANTAIFSFVNAVLLRPLPYPSADRLTILMSGLGYSGRAPFSSFEVFHLRERSTQFDQIAGIWVTNGALPGDGPAEQVKVADVTSNFLPLVCPRPALGRLFGAEDDLENAPSTIILTHGVWARRFGSDPSIIDSVSKDIPMTYVEPMQVLVDRAHADSRFASLLAILLSGIALVLAASGIYGVLSYSVAQRTNEIGIRMAIGAPRSQVLRMILADGFAWVLPGVVAGFLLSLAVTPLLARLLYGVQPTNPANYVVMLVGVLVVSAVAAFLPARRAMKIDPLTALRYE